MKAKLTERRSTSIPHVRVIEDPDLSWRCPGKFTVLLKPAVRIKRTQRRYAKYLTKADFFGASPHVPTACGNVCLVDIVHIEEIIDCLLEATTRTRSGPHSA
jgi:hypothetical protein